VTILLLDDEVSLMILMSHLLVRHGYIVLESSNAEDAIVRFQDARGQIDLLVADVILPTSTGIQVAMVFRVEVPSLRVILTSGHPQRDWNGRDSADLERLGSHSSENTPKAVYASSAVELHPRIERNATCRCRSRINPNRHTSMGCRRDRQ
jgi:CheY-like chemotaxis protein